MNAGSRRDSRSKTAGTDNELLIGETSIELKSRKAITDDRAEVFGGLLKRAKITFLFGMKVEILNNFRHCSKSVSVSS
jgi:hypothetical protein